MSIRATGRLLSVDKDTVNHWLPVLGQHSQNIRHYFFRHLHLRECQLDELWTFVAKKEAHLTPLEKLASIYGGLILDSRVVIGQVWRNRLFLQAFP